jgi:hypothetical protein
VTQDRRSDLLFLVAASLPAAVFLARPWLGGTAVYTVALTPRRLLWLGSLTKLALLATSVVFAFRSAGRFERESPIRSAWILLTIGLTGNLLGQLGLAPYQLLLGRPTPFPSVADVFFLLAYPFITLALVAFVNAYDKAGFPLGGVADRWLTALLVVGLCLSVGSVVLTPIAQAQAPLVEKALNLAYPILDFILLVPTVLLLRITLRLRGGRVGKVWLMFSLGFVLLSLADVFFAYLSGLGAAHLDPIVDALYIAAYGFLARGAVCQHHLVSV